MKRQILILFLFALSIIPLFSQSSGIRGTVSNAETGELLAYATLIHLPSGRGTATNSRGVFVMPYAEEGDSIRVSYIGFESKWLVVSSRQSFRIRLAPTATTLGEVVIKSDDDEFLYDLVIRARKNANGIDRTAKTYFFVETFLDGQHSEIIEAFFNGQYNGYGIGDLSIKKGREGMKSVNEKYYNSTESSRAFILHNPLIKELNYPDNPLMLSKKKMQKKYALSLKQIYNEEDARIYVVDCQPTEDSLGMFRTKLWIDITHQQLIKTQFQINGTYRHPFLIIGNQEARDVDMNISRTYERIGDEVRLASIDFTYKLGYLGKDNHME